MKHISKLAIIPAKKDSDRCAQKNIRQFADKPLFLYSVYYAIEEGFTPVVSTDSDKIIAICRQEQILFIREVVDDSMMENCIQQVLNHFSCDCLALLQPTSPFRKAGLLSEMSRDIANGKIKSGYTAQKIKLIGHLDGKFQLAHRVQDAKRFLYFFDGNIIVIQHDHYNHTGGLFDDDSTPYIESFPYCLQIDTEEEFDYLSTLANSAKYRKLLVEPLRKKNICVISNRKGLNRNYSDFIDSLGKVIRINKMENLDSRLSSSQTHSAFDSGDRQSLYKSKAC